MSNPYDRLDPEVESLLGEDPELLSLAQRVRASRPQPVLDPRFKAVLRAQLMREAETALAPRRRRWFSPGMGHVAWGTGALGLALVGLLAFTLTTTKPGDQQRLITVTSPVAANLHVSPAQAIKVAFNQPMDRHTVESGVRIEPATQVTYTWSTDSMELQIKPAHPLAGNTPYALTIPKEAARSAGGGRAAQDINITFGTSAPPAPAPSGPPPPPSLQPVTAGPVNPGSQVFFTPGGAPGATSSNAGAPASEPAGATPLPSLGLATATATAQPAPPVSPGVVSFPAGTSPVRLGAAAGAVAFSPNGLAWASAVSRPDGGSDIVVSRTNGSQPDPHPTVLASPAAPVTALAWSDEATVVFVDRGAIRSVDLQGHSTDLLTFDPSSSSAVLSPSGRHAVLLGTPVAAATTPPGTTPTSTPAAATDGTLVDLATKQRRTLVASNSAVIAFSGDGGTVAWVDRSQGSRRLMASATGSDTTHQVPTQNRTGDRMDFVALSHDAARVAYQLNGARLLIAQSDGAVLAAGGAVAGLVFSPHADRVAYLTGSGGATSLVVASVPGTPARLQQSPGLPAAAQQSLDAFVDAQVHHDDARLAQLSAGSVDAAGSTPASLTRGYVISVSQRQDGSVSATARLILDAGHGAASAQGTDESLTLAAPGPGGTWRVSRLSVPPLTDETVGPHVIRAQPDTEKGRGVLQVTFDADLRPETVTGAITVQTPDGTTILGVDVRYDANTRTATVTLPAGGGRSVVLVVDAGVTDINGNALARPFQATF